jgi:hypothetical protein
MTAPGSLPGKHFDGHPSFAAIHGTTPEPTRVVVIRTSHFNALAGLHLDRVPILSFIFPLNARLSVRVCHSDNSDSFSLPSRRQYGVEQLDQHCAVSKHLPLRLAGCFRDSGQYEVAEQVQSRGQYRWGKSAVESYTWSPSHDQCGMLRPLGTSSADLW